MATRIVGRLKSKQVTNAKPAEGKDRALIPDGGNLFLQVTRGKEGHVSRSWCFKFERLGRRHEMGLGPSHTVSLAEARAEARELRQQLLKGINPLAARQQIRRDQLDQLAAEQRAMTFRACAEACIASHESGWTNRKHREQWTSSLEQYAYPVLGDMAVDDIATPHIVKVLEPIWKTIPETASRVRGRVEKVLGWAAVRGFRGGDNPARWRGHLAELFPAKGKVAATKHLAAMPFSDVPAFVVELRQRDALDAHGLEFAILTAARTGEITGATWDEFDLGAKTWTIPGKRMKGKREHRVSLSDRAIAILSALPSKGDRVFPLSDRAMIDLLQDMRPGNTDTVHGFRSSFRDWAGERTNVANHVVEAALAHAIGNKVEAAYRRGDLFEKRRRLMQQWADYCGKPLPAGATVTPLRRAGAGA
jgi:integrase